ncbi:hypothetical protein [Roseateles puraquae]|uniref:hypothetical protein n=1 Tax=Roseateles puraquae TaxID=431059 RepID=UPI0031E09CD8
MLTGRIGYVLYVEGGTDIDMLRGLAERLQHPVADIWDERINSFYVQNNYPLQDVDAELERVEGGFGLTPREHFNGLRNLLPSLQGVAILDNDGQNRQDRDEGALRIRYWRRYEAENYFITPELLRRYAYAHYPADDLFTSQARQGVDDALAETLVELVFDGNPEDYEIWLQSPADAARLIWETQTARRKLSAIAEEFFRRLAQKVGGGMLLKKGEFHRLIEHAELSTTAEAEVRAKLDLLMALFHSARQHGETNRVDTTSPEALDDKDQGSDMDSEGLTA